MKQLVKIFGRFASKQAEGNGRRPSRRPLCSETLEKRQLLAGDILPAHNYAIPEDVNRDWRVTPLDALLVLNHLRNQNNGRATFAEGEDGGVKHLVDVNGDNNITPLDALRVLNRLSKGEANGEVLEFGLNARDEHDQEFTASAFNPATRQLTVGVGEIFQLEVEHLDLRAPALRGGVFAMFSDILVDQSGYLEPVLTETQFVTLGIDLLDATGGQLDFSLEGGSETLTRDYSAMTVAQLASFIQTSVRTLTGDDGVVVNGLSRAEDDPFEFRIRYTDYALAGIDLPDVIITPRLTDAFGDPIIVSSVSDDIPPVVAGQLNPLAVADNIDFFSRSYQPWRPRGGAPFFGQTYYDGTFDQDTGFLHLGGVGPLRTDPFEEDDADFSNWFDSYSIPVRIVAPVENLQLSLRAPTDVSGDSTAGSGFGSIFYFSQDVIPPDLIQVDLTPNQGRGLLSVTATSSGETSITVQNGSLSAQQDGGPRTLDLSTLVTTTPAGAPVTYTLAQQAANGTASISGSILTYTPGAGFAGLDQVQFTASTPGAAPVTRLVSIDVVAAPVVSVVANDASLTATQNGPAVSLNLASSIVVTGSSTTPVVTTSSAGKGTITVSGTTVTYTPAAGEVGADSFTYTATVNGVSDSATVNVTINAAAVVVTASDGNLLATENGPTVTLDLRPLVSVTGGSGSEVPVIAIVGNPGKGTVAVSGGVATYTPTAGQTGADSFIYSATVNGVTDTGTINVLISPEHTVTIAAADGSMTATQNGGSVTLNALALVTTNSTDAPTLAITTLPGKGSVTIVGGEFIYTPAANQSGVDTFVYTASVPGASDTGTITVTINAQVVTVQARDGSLNANQDGAPVALNVASLVTVTGSSATPTISIASQPGKGSVTVNGTNVIYTPAPGQSGADSFTYTATVNGVSDTGTITATIAPQAVTVQAGDGSLTAVQDGSGVSLNVAALVTVTGSSAAPTISISGQPTKGSVTVSGGVVTYTPAAGQSGADSFVYTATVGGVSDTGTISVSISAAPVVVVADNGSLAADENGGSRTINLASLVNVTGSSAAPVFTIVTPPTRGTATINGSVLTYTPSTDQFGNDTIVYRASVGGVSDTGTIAVTIAPIVAAPIARPDSVTGIANTPTTITSSQLLANDSAARPNPSGQPPVVTGASAIAGTTVGTVTFSAATGNITYTPPAGFVGQTSFQYTISSEGQTATGIVTVTVQDFVPSTISGSVFMDLPASYYNPQTNGERDADEPAMGGVVVRLTSPASGNLLGQNIDRIIRTDAEGEYHFDGVAPGTYRVTFERPETLSTGGAYDNGSSGVGTESESFVIEIGSAGGVHHSALDFTVHGYKGAAASAGQLLVSDFLLLHPNSPNNIGRADYGLATMVVGSSGQTSFDLTQGFDGVLFAEIAVGRSGGSALLTMIMEDGSVKTAMLSKDAGDFVVSSNGAVVHVLRNVEHMSFINSPDDIIRQEYGDYRSAVDQVLAAGL